MLTEMPLGILSMSQVITDQVVLKALNKHMNHKPFHC